MCCTDKIVLVAGYWCGDTQIEDREARLVASRGTVVGGGGSLGTGGWDTAHMTPSSQAVPVEQTHWDH